MNKPLTSVGILLALFGSFLFYGVFVGVTPGFVAFLLALILVPIGSGVLFFGAAYRRPLMSQPAAMGGGGGATTGTVWAAIGVAVVAILLAVASLSIAFSAQSAANSASNSASQANSGIAAINGTISNSGIKPTTIAFKVDWCNTDNTGEDRFCPNELVVNQGDVVQIMFIHNDTDVHTFTLDTSPYFFQINDSTTMMHNFINNLSISGNCSNTGTIAQQSAGISGVYCVSGNSLLPAAGNFKIAQNPNPASPGNGSKGIPLIDVKMDNMVHVVVFNFTAGASEVWGVGSFQVTQPGIYEFFCHYHVSNGMFGYLIVLPNAYCTATPSACGVKA